MNNVWTENPAGLFKDSPINYHEHNLFGSEQFAGGKQYLGYNENLICDTSDPTSVCGVSTPISYIDPYKKAISILHYSNYLYYTILIVVFLIFMVNNFMLMRKQENY
jgi:hypothetical protein